MQHLSGTLRLCSFNLIGGVSSPHYGEDFIDAFLFQRQLDWFAKDAVASNLLALWHDSWHAMGFQAGIFADLARSAPVYLDREVYDNGVLNLINGFLSALCPLGSTRTLAVSRGFAPSFCPVN
ncbi:unnamed protein product [Calypogeia fissa]